MTSNLTAASLLRSELRALGRADGIASVQRLTGGVIAEAWLVSYADGTRVVGKTLAGAPADVFGAEAEGLAALRVTGHLPTPRVLAVTSRLLLLEALPPRDDRVMSWEGLARGMAALHRGPVHDRFGWHRDGYLGRLPQVNTWTASGHEFFAQHRLLRYLREPAAWQVLTAADRRATERLCDRLPQVIPAMPAVLTHGDLWSGNLLSRDGEMAVIDPAVSFSWAETDLSMLWCCPRPPASERFFELYQELNPSPAGWAERMPVLHLRELLSTIAHFGDQVPDTVAQIRRTLTPFY
ncbi:MAG: fructosamine kinase family protein [Actinomycetota bacterium]|nr:fructosamine kinase family protein [Actinomycetota bacterium]